VKYVCSIKKKLAHGGQLYWVFPFSKGSLVEHSRQARGQQSVTKFIIDNVVFWSHFVVLLMSNLDVQQSSQRKARGQKYASLNFKFKKMRKANFSKLLSKLEWVECIVVNFILSF